ncbi:MAG: helix-turn-helix domain-containing protein [Magnetococcales bacterium]|nr:helix-turn-helix domain-containing protein [Magnetococcales bacterium]
MSHATMYWAMEQEIPSMPKLTLIMLAKHADQKHQCFPSLERLAKLCQCHRRSISRSLKFLTENRLITELRRWRRRGGQATSLFTLHVSDPPGRRDKTSRQGEHPVPSMDDKKYRHEGPDVMHMHDTVSPIIKEEPSTENLNSPRNPPPTPSRRVLRDDPTVLSVEVVTAVSDPDHSSRTPALMESTVCWDVEGAFKRFWECYPHKVHYGKAWDSWQKLVGTPELANTIIDDVQNRCRYHAPWVRALREGTLRYIPLPVNYLVGMRWMDAIEGREHGIGGNHRQGNFERVTAKLDALLSRCRSGQQVWGGDVPGGFAREDSFVLEADGGYLRDAMDLSVW